MIADVKPGDMIQITITRDPLDEPDKKTLRRLMLINTEAQREKVKSLRHRETQFDPHQRGGRIWTSKPRAPRFSIPTAGKTWNMRYRPQLDADLRAVGDLIEISKA